MIATAATACAGSELAFSAADSVDGDGEITDYSWNFGDGTGASGVAVAHTFSRPGRYHVTLAVDDGTAVSNSRRQAALTLPVNHPPSAQAGPDLVACSGQEVILDGTGSADPDGELVLFQWNCGDSNELTGTWYLRSHAHRQRRPWQHLRHRHRQRRGAHQPGAGRGSCLPGGGGKKVARQTQWIP